MLSLNHSNSMSIGMRLLADSNLSTLPCNLEISSFGGIHMAWWIHWSWHHQIPHTTCGGIKRDIWKLNYFVSLFTCPNSLPKITFMCVYVYLNCKNDTPF